MARIAGIEIPNSKKTFIGLTYLYGIGRSNVNKVLTLANVNGDKRIKELTDEEISRLIKAIENIAVEGDLRRQVQSNIQLLRDIGSYRGSRHARNLPVRGQRTRSNARTKRGKRVTIGAVKKDVLARQTQAAPVKK